MLAASHELANGGMSAARVLLQRGLRLNADSAEMWREYVRLELGFVEALRRRWDVLGISLGDSSDRGPGQEQESQGERIDRAEEAAMGDEARGAIMDGAIVRQAIDGAAKGEHTHPRWQCALLHTSRSSSCAESHLYPYCVISAADDRAVSESADSHCRLSGTRVFPQLVAGSSACAIGRQLTASRGCREVACDTGAGSHICRGACRERTGRCAEACQ